LKGFDVFFFYFFAAKNQAEASISLWKVIADKECGGKHG